ncbi:aluminum-activated malate transporter 2 [Ricinus communis]|uniref:Aluminum-activated malate transporter n=1 Tax=Ricinus communis TaxID=3988 RepID=B9SP44_RICCO|nr:aluminum-activated malate transporter 2 [Ricinus communis]EEF34624.1 conserved hypothetical protein [Ricinus communis]|eukprot:XP_002527763.1 aluminum-activated malate transporter 2 [Ricinus communis]
MALPITSNQENVGSSICGFHWLHAFLASLRAKVLEIAKYAKKIAKDDPRRIIHSLKAGLAVILVSLLYYIEPLYNSFGVNTTWAVLTAVVVFEFSVGATLGRGLSRMLATLVAGALGLGAHRLATLSGDMSEAIVINVIVFSIVAIVSFARFFPKMKARFDYGLMIFILTFSLIAVSGYREESIPKMALERLTTIVAGSCVTILVNICIFPVWIGQDLHNLVAANLEKLGNFLLGFGGEYFGVSEDEDAPNEDRSFLQGYKSVLTSQSGQENMVNLARWEPGHGRFRFRHPWKQYLKIGNLIHQCAIKIDALNNYLDPQIQTPMEIRRKIQEQCTEISLECGRALRESSLSLKTMARNESARLHVANSKTAAENLKSLIKIGLWEEADLLEITSVTAVATLLMGTVQSTERIVDAVHELASMAGFKTEITTSSFIQRVHDVNVQNHEITMGGE